MVIKAKSSQQGTQQYAGYTVFRRESSAECQNDVKWLKGVPSSQERVEWPEERRIAMKALSNQNGKERSQESARKAPSGQKDFERPVVLKGRTAVRRERLKRVLNSLQVAPISHWRARSGRW